MNENIEKFVDEAAKSLEDGSFVRLVLSNYKGADRGLQRISVRLIDTKRGARLMFQSRFDTRDVVKNFEFAEGTEEIRRNLNEGFRNAHLFTVSQDLQLDIGKRSSRIRSGKPSVTALPGPDHDKKKRSFIDRDAFYLKALGISDEEGRVKPSQQDKWRQINKFVEILAGLVDGSELKDKSHLRIVDMGSGKGYLTFAAYDYLTNVRGRSVTMTGVEARKELVDLCSGIANAGGFEGLSFSQGQIADFPAGDSDILIALHACDTATDDALFKGSALNASIIVAAPCCHKELRKQIKPPEMLAGILKHGVMLERTAETITDGLRALLLEGEGYSTKLFEFVPTEHTPKNNMLAATKTRGRQVNNARRQASDVMASFGVEHQRLKELLNETK